MNRSFHSFKPLAFRLICVSAARRRATAAILAVLAGIVPLCAQSLSNPARSHVTPPNYVPTAQSLPDGGLVWDATTKTLDAVSGQDFARFEFSFANVTATAVTIQNVHPSCGCTTAELPPVPWTIPAGSTGRIKVKVNLAGKFGTVFKSVTVTTDKGRGTLALRINIANPTNPANTQTMTQAQRDAGVAIAKVDRQAVFKNDCASCHLKNVQGNYGPPLYEAACGICHEANPRATMVPDLHNLPVPTNLDFWRTWIASGKPGTLMPAFASSQGGPLNDAQITSLATYLNSAIPSHAPLTAK